MIRNITMILNNLYRPATRIYYYNVIYQKKKQSLEINIKSAD